MSDGLNLNDPGALSQESIDFLRTLEHQPSPPRGGGPGYNAGPSTFSTDFGAGGWGPMPAGVGGGWGPMPAGVGSGSWGHMPPGVGAGSWGPMPVGVGGGGWGPMPMSFGGWSPMPATGYASMPATGYVPNAPLTGHAPNAPATGYVPAITAFNEMPAPPGFGTVPQASIGNPPFQANAAGPSGPRSPPSIHSQAPAFHQTRYHYVPTLVDPEHARLVGPGNPGESSGIPASPPRSTTSEPPDPYSRTFGDALADSRRQGMPVGNFMPSNQTPLDASSISSVSRFFTSTPELAAAQERIHAFTSNHQSMANQDANDKNSRLSTFASVPHPKGGKKSLANPPFIVPSQAVASSSKIPKDSSAQAVAGSSKGVAAVGTSKGATAARTSMGTAAAGTSKQPEASHPDNRMTISPSVVNGEDAVKAAYQTFSQQVDNSMNLRASERPYALAPAMIQILKEWTIGFLASRILGGQFPSQGEVLRICRMTAESPEAVLLFSMSGLYPVPNARKPTLVEWRQRIGEEGIAFFETRVIAPTAAQVLQWKTHLLRSVLLYTICHVLTSSLIFPDYAYSDPIDSTLGVRTLLLAKTGAYMHFYTLRSAREYVNSFRTMLDSAQHPTAMTAYDMALDIQRNKEESRTDCYLFGHAALGKVVGCVIHALINSNCSVVVKFLLGENVVVNHQLQLAGEKPGQHLMLAPFCCSILTLALAGVEEFGYQLTVDNILHSETLMELLFVKAGYVRDFITFIRSSGTDNEKHDIEWLNTSIKTRVAMAITPFHQNTVADLGVVAQPSRSKDFPLQFASLESLSEFERTYKGYENDSQVSDVVQNNWVRVQEANSERLRVRKDTEQLTDASEHYLQGLLQLGTRPFQHAGRNDSSARAPAAAAATYPSLQSGPPSHNAAAAIDVGSPMQEVNDVSNESSGDESE